MAEKWDRWKKIYLYIFFHFYFPSLFFLFTAVDAPDEWTGWQKYKIFSHKMEQMYVCIKKQSCSRTNQSIGGNKNNTAERMWTIFHGENCSGPTTKTSNRKCGGKARAACERRPRRLSTDWIGALPVTRSCIERGRPATVVAARRYIRKQQGRVLRRSTATSYRQWDNSYHRKKKPVYTSVSAVYTATCTINSFFEMICFFPLINGRSVKPKIKT